MPEDGLTSPNGAAAPDFIVRPRSAADLEACRPTAELVQRVDGYPGAAVADIVDFMSCPDAYAAWVAVAGPDIIGHAVLKPSAAPGVLELACQASGRGADAMAVVGRLWVAPDHRRRGVARSLLATAVAAAHEAGLWPLLDTVATNARSIALYESAGWVRLGTVDVTFSGGLRLLLVAFLGPMPPAAGEPVQEAAPGGDG
ncbi:MAG TPA: GNAT family N-acetyltransferase [Acidimicrobiales bacterium]|nr:GNAT family N-acetyltransferase [Acidimicrobiales bacterium]